MSTCPECGGEESSWHICKNGVKVPSEPIKKMVAASLKYDKLITNAIRKNDELWCKALVGTLSVDDMNKVLTAYLNRNKSCTMLPLWKTVTRSMATLC